MCQLRGAAGTQRTGPCCVEEDHRIELSPLPVDRISSPVSFQSIDLPELVERVERIELSRYPWQGHRLPLHHTRKNLAETERFELSVRITAYDRLATCCLRPLGHVSLLLLLLYSENQNKSIKIRHCIEFKGSQVPQEPTSHM